MQQYLDRSVLKNEGLDEIYGRTQELIQMKTEERLTEGLALSDLHKRIEAFEAIDVDKSRQRLLTLGPGWQSFTENY
jgi:hypothetical protein